MATIARAGRTPAVAVQSLDEEGWDDGTFLGVAAIVLYTSQMINSVQFQYVDDGGNYVWGETHGQPNGKRHEIALDYYSGERLVSLAVYQDDVVKSLTFETNRRTFGPYGTSKGTSSKFEDFSNEKRLGNNVMFKTNQITSGPYGTKKHSSSSYSVVKSSGSHFRHQERRVESVSFATNKATLGQYDTSKGTRAYSHKESWSSSDPYQGHHVVKFESKQNAFGPYGTKQGTDTKFEGNFLGFYGTADVVLESITPHLG